MNIAIATGVFSEGSREIEGRADCQPDRVGGMITIILIIIVMGLGLFFLWPIPYFAILVIGAHPIFWGVLAVLLGLIVAAVTVLRIFNEDDDDRTKTPDAP